MPLDQMSVFVAGVVSAFFSANLDRSAKEIQLNTTLYMGFD